MKRIRLTIDFDLTDDVFEGVFQEVVNDIEEGKFQQDWKESIGGKHCKAKWQIIAETKGAELTHTRK